MTQSSNDRDRELVGILDSIESHIKELVKITKENNEVLKTMDWKLWEQMKVLKSQAYADNLEIFEPQELDKDNK